MFTIFNDFRITGNILRGVLLQSVPRVVLQYFKICIAIFQDVVENKREKLSYIKNCEWEYISPIRVHWGKFLPTVHIDEKIRKTEAGSDCHCWIK